MNSPANDWLTGRLFDFTRLNVDFSYPRLTADRAKADEQLSAHPGHVVAPSSPRISTARLVSEPNIA
jgi:hypothetical protein